jgi:hypothetical protein
VCLSRKTSLIALDHGFSSSSSTRLSMPSVGLRGAECTYGWQSTRGPLHAWARGVRSVRAPHTKRRAIHIPPHGLHLYERAGHDSTYRSPRGAVRLACKARGQALRGLYQRERWFLILRGVDRFVPTQGFPTGVSAFGTPVTLGGENGGPIPLALQSRSRVFLGPRQLFWQEKCNAGEQGSKSRIA